MAEVTDTNNKEEFTQVSCTGTRRSILHIICGPREQIGGDPGEATWVTEAVDPEKRP